MSVVEALEKFNSKHAEVPEDDKAGWKRLIQGAMSKAVDLFWTAGGSIDVSLGPDSADNIPVFTDMRSPSSDKYLSASLDSSEDYVSLDDTSSFRVTSPGELDPSRPGSHSTPYRTKEGEAVVKRPAGKEDKCPSSKLSSAGRVSSGLLGRDGETHIPDFSELCLELERHSTPCRTEKVITEETKVKRHTGKVDVRPMSKVSSGLSGREGATGTPDFSELCSEMERLSLKKMISEVEKSLAEDVKDDFDCIRKRMEEHDRKVEEELTREREQKEVENELTEMNWFQRIRESQLHIEQNFNSNLDEILAKLKKNESTLKSVGKPALIKPTADKSTELEVVAKKRALLESIGNTQKSYNIKYNDLLHLLQSSRVSLVTEFHNEFDSLKRNNVLLTDIISKSRCGNVSESDVEQCDSLLASLSDVFDKIMLRNKEYENAKKLEEEANAKLNEALKKNQENSEGLTVEVAKSPVKHQVHIDEKEDSIKEEPAESSSGFSRRRKDRLKYYKYVHRMLKKAESSLEPFLNDDKYKNFRKDCQRAVNTPVNAISPTSSEHLRDKLNKLADLLDGNSVPIGNRKFSAKLHPMGVKYCEVLLARKIVKVGEDVVSSHPETGHAVASVVVCLTMRYPVLTLYLHAFFFEVCPYLVPLDLQPLSDETDEQYNRRLGFNYEAGEREETDKFLKRMSGVAQLYGALLIVNKRRSDSSLTAPLGISELWIWISNFISLEPLSDISATLLLDILEVAGHFMLTKYQYNFQKLLYLICTDYLEKIHKVTAKGRSGPVERLKTFLEDVIKVKRIPPPKGFLPPHFW